MADKRSVSKETNSLMSLLSQLTGQQSSAYLDSQKQLYDYQMSRLPGDFRTMAGLQAEATGKERLAAIDFLGESGDDALAAFLKSNPMEAQSLTGLSAMAGAMGNTPEITQLLDQRALDDLKLGRTLSPEQEREAQQSARAGFAARGMATGPASAAAEILNRDRYATSRDESRRATAAAREASNRTFALSEAALQDQVNPAMKILGMPSSASATLGQTMGFVQGVQTPDPTGIMGAGMNYLGDLFNTNLSMQASQEMGQMNYAAAQAAGNQGMMGSIFGGGLAAAGTIGAGAFMAF